MTRREPDRLSRYYSAVQEDGRGWLLIRLDAIGSNTATVLAVNLSESDAIRQLDELRAIEVLDPGFPMEQVDSDLRAAGGDPEAIGKRGAELVRGLLAKRRDRLS